VLLRALDLLRWERIGVEPSPTVDVEEAVSAGVIMVRGLLEDAPLPENSFDVVVGIDLLEHLRDARAFTHRLRRFVRDGGFAVAVTSDISSFFARLSGARWGYFGSREHISFFTPLSVKHLFEDSGFTVVENRQISHDQRIRGIHSFFILAIPIAAKNFVKRVLNLTRPGRPNKIRRYPLPFDHMLVVARATEEPYLGIPAGLKPCTLIRNSSRQRYVHAHQAIR
jgi:SAM-dependent methyltransferase